MYPKIILILAILGCTAAANAQTMNQGETKIGLMYNFGMPNGSFKADVVGQNSPRGMALEVMHYLSERVAVGGGFAYQDFYDKWPRRTFRQSDGSDISAVITHSIQTIPIMGRVQYFPTAGGESTSGILPFLTAGAGVNLVQFEQLFGELTNISEFNVRFAAMGGAGIRIPFGKEKANAFMLSGNYMFMPYNKFEIPNFNHLSIQAGIQIRLRDDGGGRMDRWSPPNDRYRDRYRSWW